MKTCKKAVSTLLKPYLLVGVSAFGLATVAHAQAQTADTAPAAASATPADAGAVEELVVTVRKRQEAAQSVPDPITVISSGVIQRADIHTIQDVARLVPNLVIYDQLRPGIQTVSLRGFTTVQGGKPPFATIIDGVQQPGLEYLSQSLVDIDQIEMVRGPQGTLYGGGAIAGALNIVTKRPTDTYEGAVRGAYRSGPSYEGSATISGPIKKDFAYFRASVYGLDDDGQIKNTTTHNDVDFRHDFSTQGRLLVTPSQQLTVDLQGRYSQGRDGALWLVTVPNDDFQDLKHYKPNNNTEGVDHHKIYSLSANVADDLGFATLTSITAYNKADQHLHADGDFGPADTNQQNWTTNTNSVSEELRLASNGTGKLKWLLGAFAQRYKIYDDAEWGVVQPDSSVTYYPDANRYLSHSIAAFGQAEYAFTDKLTGTVGMRYDYDHQTAHDVDTQSNGEQKKNFKKFQPKVELSYKWTPDVLTYVSYGTGFRTGGFNPNSPIAQRVYKNETSENFEFGFKSGFAQNRLLVNGALFHTNFDNQQFFFSTITTDGVYRGIINIPKTRVNGAELEVVARPVTGLNLNGSLGYNDTKIHKFPSDLADEGNHTPQVAGFTAAFGAEYFYEIGDGFRLVPRVDVSHRGTIYWDTANTVKTTPRTLINLRVALEKDQWSLAFVGRNLTDKVYPGAVGTPGATSTLVAYSQRRQLGVELSTRF